MDPVISGSLISGAANLIGGLFGRSAQKKANEQNIALAREQADNQREFAQQGVQWKVADAKAAGIHPLYALGANTVSYSPVSVGVQPASIGDSISSMGQNIGRAVAASSTHQQRMENLLEQKTMAEIDLLKSQSSSVARASNPAMPAAGTGNFIPGQGDSGVIVNPVQTTARADGTDGSVEAGNYPDLGYTAGRGAVRYPIPPKDVSEALESSYLSSVLWSLRNQVGPNFGYEKPPSNAGLKPGYKYEWDWVYQGYRPRMTYDEFKKRGVKRVLSDWWNNRSDY